MNHHSAIDQNPSHELLRTALNGRLRYHLPTGINYCLLEMLVLLLL